MTEQNQTDTEPQIAAIEADGQQIENINDIPDDANHVHVRFGNGYQISYENQDNGTGRSYLNPDGEFRFSDSFDVPPAEAAKGEIEYIQEQPDDGSARRAYGAEPFGVEI